MKKYSNILNEYDKNKLQLIINLNKENYKTSSVIYASPYFINGMIQEVSYQTGIIEEINENKCDFGFNGMYYGNPVVCMPNLTKNSAIIVPNIKDILEDIYDK